MIRRGKILGSLLLAIWRLDSEYGVLTRLPSGKFTVSTNIILDYFDDVHIFSIDPKDENGNVLVIEEVLRL